MYSGHAFFSWVLHARACWSVAMDCFLYTKFRPSLKVVCDSSLFVASGESDLSTPAAWSEWTQSDAGALNGFGGARDIPAIVGAIDNAPLLNMDCVEVLLILDLVMSNLRRF